MTARFDRPTATADRAQNLTDTKDTLVLVAKQLDDTTPPGVASGMLRWSSSNNKWQKYNGSTWVDLAATFSMNVSHLGGLAASSYLPKSGGTLTGFLTLHANPSSSMHASTKQYADGLTKVVPRLTSYNVSTAPGSCVAVSAGFTLATGLAAGTVLSVYNDSASAITLTQGSGLTLRLAGTTATGNRTLQPRGLATIWANSTTEYIVTGAGVS